MNKRTLIVVGIGLAAALGVGGYFLLSNKTETGESDSISEQTTFETPDSLRKLLDLSTSQECSFVDEAGSQGVVFASSGNVRGDFISTVEETITNSHMISDGNNMYFWFDGAESGFMVSLDAYDQTGVSGQRSVDLDRKVDYECKSWNVDKSKFILPDLKFVDYSTLMPSGVSTPTSDSSGQENSDSETDACSACDGLSGEAKSQCLQALGCN